MSAQRNAVTMSACRGVARTGWTPRQVAVLGLPSLLDQLVHVQSLPAIRGNAPRVLRAGPATRAARGGRGQGVLGGRPRSPSPATQRSRVCSISSPEPTGALDPRGCNQSRSWGSALDLRSHGPRVALPRLGRSRRLIAFWAGGYGGQVASDARSYTVRSIAVPGGRLTPGFRYLIGSPSGAACH